MPNVSSIISPNNRRMKLKYVSVGKKQPSSMLYLGDKFSDVSKRRTTAGGVPISPSLPVPNGLCRTVDNVRSSAQWRYRWKWRGCPALLSSPCRRRRRRRRRWWPWWRCPYAAGGWSSRSRVPKTMTTGPFSHHLSVVSVVLDGPFPS